ncbi:MAG: glycosyltransferase family 4 protein [Cyclobacteriaceae bacterium]
MKKVVINNYYPSEFDTQTSMGTKNELVVTYLSNIMRSKGIMEFLQACTLITERHQNVKFQMAGAFMGDHLKTRRQIKSQVNTYLKRNENLGLEFLGYLPVEKRLDFLSRSSILVFPSFYPSEAFPLVIVEAMRCGNAIVASEHNYLPDIVRGNNGVIVPKRDSQAVATAVIDLIDNPQTLQNIISFNVNYAKLHFSESGYLKSLHRLLA